MHDALGGVLGQLDLAEREVGHDGIGQRRDLVRVARLVVDDEERALLERRDRLGIDVVEPEAAGVAERASAKGERDDARAS